jgi:predicted GNAT family acetyltransferase
VPGRYWIVADGAGPLGVVLQSPHHFPVALTPMPDDAVVAVVSAIADAGVALPGVSGEAATAARFAAQWAERTLTAAEPFNGQRIYELEGAPSPRRVGGCLRLAEAPDCGLILDWMRSFYADIGEQNISDAEVVVSRRVAAGNFWLWQDDGPCSVAAHTDAAAGVVRIQAVYTPSPLRGHGYAGACVSALSAQLQDAGHRCILYADLANPVSNRLYRGLGYRAAVECLRYRFG